MDKFTTMWARVFNTDEFVSTLKWENSQNTDNLDDSDCPSYGAIFNSKSKKFDVRAYDEEHYALCETPRWAKLQCTDEWHLISPIRMCLKVHKTYAQFVEAHDNCRNEGSFVSTAKDGSERDMFREVIKTFKLRNVAAYDDDRRAHGGFWNGQRKPPNGMEMFTLDGTETTIQPDPETVKPRDNLCHANTYNDWVFRGKPRKGVLLGCREQFPYMCQRLADQSTTNNVH